MNRDFNSVPYVIAPGSLASAADAANYVGNGTIPLRSKIKGVDVVVGSGGYAGAATNYHTLDVRYIDRDGNSGAVCTITTNTAASGGVGTLVAGKAKALSLTYTNQVLPAGASLVMLVSKEGNGKAIPLPRFTFDLEPMSL